MVGSLPVDAAHGVFHRVYFPSSFWRSD